MLLFGNRYDIKLYQNYLRSSDGKKAREYLHNRGLDDEIIEEFVSRV